MSDAYSILGVSMSNDLERLSMISHNLANSITTGFKKQIPVNDTFTDMLSTMTRSMSGVEKNSSIPVSIPKVIGVIDDSQGAIKNTGNSLDLAINDDNYFAVLTETGMAYTKQGSFKIDQNGLLVDKQNNPVLGVGGEIHLSGNEVFIGNDGVIKDGNKEAGKLFVASIKKPEILSNIGNGLFVTSEQVDVANIGDVNIKQKYLEMSNVTMMEEMIKLIEVTRHFETSQRFMMGYDSMLDNAINVVGEI